MGSVYLEWGRDQTAVALVLPWVEVCVAREALERLTGGQVKIGDKDSEALFIIWKTLGENGWVGVLFCLF